MEPKFTSDITVRLVQQVGGDHMVVAAAKVSTSGEDALQWTNPDAKEDNYGLIRYLMKHRHGTPFEHSLLTFFVRAPIFVWREWHRHRIGHSFNEESGRYKVLEPEFYLPPRNRPMMKVEGWKPGRPKFLTLDEHFGDEQTYGGDRYPSEANRMSKADAAYRVLCDNLEASYRTAYAVYTDNLAMSIDPGLARACLPVGIYSSCWVTVNPRSLMAFLSLRTHEPEAAFPSYPLYEIDEAARQCERLFAAGWPLTYKAFNECGRAAP